MLNHLAVLRGKQLGLMNTSLPTAEGGLRDVGQARICCKVGTQGPRDTQVRLKQLSKGVARLGQKEDEE